DRFVRRPAFDLAGDDLVQFYDPVPVGHAALNGPDQLAAFDLRLLQVVDSDNVGALDRRFVDLALGPAVGADGRDVRAGIERGAVEYGLAAGGHGDDDMRALDGVFGGG